MKNVVLESEGSYYIRIYARQSIENLYELFMRRAYALEEEIKAIQKEDPESTRATEKQKQKEAVEKLKEYAANALEEIKAAN